MSQHLPLLLQTPAACYCENDLIHDIPDQVQAQHPPKCSDSGNSYFAAHDDLSSFCLQHREIHSDNIGVAVVNVGIQALHNLPLGANLSTAQYICKYAAVLLFGFGL